MEIGTETSKFECKKIRYYTLSGRKYRTFAVLEYASGDKYYQGIKDDSDRLIDNDYDMYADAMRSNLILTFSRYGGLNKVSGNSNDGINSVPLLVDDDDYTAIRTIFIENA